MKLKTLLIGLLTTATCWAAPNSSEQARLKPLLPKDHNLVDCIDVHLLNKADTVAITEKDAKFYLFVVPKKAKTAITVSTMHKQNCLVAPVQGALHPKLSQLVYSKDLDKNGKPYLFVHTYMADASGIHVFKPGAKNYMEIFQAGTISEFSVDPSGRKISRPASDADTAKTWVWKNGHFVESK